MLSDEVIERFKKKLPTITGDHQIYGITHLDIKCRDGSVKQIGDYYQIYVWKINSKAKFSVLLFERLRVDEPENFLRNKQIYADVFVKIDDEVLVDIASKEISLEDAINQKMFRVYGDREIWKRQLEALKKILPNENFTPRPKEPEVASENDEAAGVEDSIDFGNLPRMDLSDVPKEFKALSDHLAGLSLKYPTQNATK